MSTLLTIAFIPVLYAILCLAEVIGRVLVRWEHRLDGDVKLSTINRIGKILAWLHLKFWRSALYKFYRVGRRLKRK